ncbi:hypothetical protein HOLleu_10134 [Holothuria leucospilota]|uniref:Uncharacterized protein n=1 Tax=Holothuria leucospilota TaxID=206669 RepID=A0A9Q1CDR2_HOLLE|nr:hypothetical protein HOLleu_10134 [Holothuria leucospilota]
MIASCLMLVLIVLFGLANHSSCQTCDLFNQRSERCLALSTNTFCGMPPVTQEQIRQAQAAAETIRMIEQIGGPIVDGSQEALQLGISVDNPIVNLTVEQGNFYRRCQGSNLLTPDTSFTLKRRKRQTTQSNSCCSPSPNRVKLVASVDENDRAVQLVQPPGLAQLFPATTNCPSSTCTGQITCGPVRTFVPADALILQPFVASGRINIAVDICGAISTVQFG